MIGHEVGFNQVVGHEVIGRSRAKGSDGVVLFNRRIGS